ncbi:MAG: winged helix-turn-helix domain-containing protein [Hyphomicrobiaceae bacterium]
MKTGPSISTIASLIGDPARANILMSLMDGRALTASELAQHAGVSLPTASSHLGKLESGQLLTMEKQGRHRYFRLANGDVAHALETLMGLAEKSGHRPIRTGPKDPEMRAARVCYDHLAGERAVALFDRLISRKYLTVGHDGLLPSRSGRVFFQSIGIEMGPLEQLRRPMCRACLDWSSRRNHLAGSLGKAILDHALEAGWAARDQGSRVIRFTRTGEQKFTRAYEM